MIEQDAGPGSEPASSQPWIIRHGWLLSAVWLVFMAFPLFAAWGGSSSDERKLGATALMFAFGAVYVAGFRHQHQAEQRDRYSPVSPGDDPSITGWRFLIVLIAINLAAFALVGIASLGLVPFVVSFAAFNLRWALAWAVLAAGVVATVVVPLAIGEFGQIWFLSLVVAAVGGANLLIRVFGGHEVEQSHLRTGLALSEERGRVARDVHDILGHSLTAVILKAELCQRLLDQVDSVDAADRDRIETCHQHLTELRSVSRSALAEIRSTVGGLRAANLADELTVARTVLADSGVGLLVTGEPSDVPEAKRPTMAWVVREAVTNIVRHARASTCHIELAPEPGRVWLRISDDGVGLRSGDGQTNEGNGLRGIRERVETVGARLQITGDEGTRLEVVR